MVCKEWTKSVKGVDDVELGIPRTNPLIFHCTAPESGRAQGLVFVILDFGDAANSDHHRNFRAYLAETHNLLAVTVDYHCHQSRLPTGAQFSLSTEDLADLRALGAKHGILEAEPATLIGALATLTEHHEFDVHIAPSNGDYQNLGVIQALDHLTVLADLLSMHEGGFDQENIVAIGASHGAYIAHMISKFAPNTLRAVIDNSSYTDPGRGLLRVAPVILGNLRLNCRLVNKWIFDSPSSPNYFLRGRRMIRRTSTQSEIVEMGRFSQRTCQYRMIHSVHDGLEPIEEKRAQAQWLGEAGFDVVLKEISEQQDSDSEMFKASALGVEASLRTVFDYFYPTLTPKPGRLDCELGSDIAYFCDDYYYSFLHQKDGCLMRVVPVPTAAPAPKFYGQSNYGRQRVEFHIGVIGY